MDSALQLGQSSVQMSFIVEATTVLNSMSERLYTAEKEVNCYVLFLLPKIAIIYSYILLLVSGLYERYNKNRRTIYKTIGGNFEKI